MKRCLIKAICYNRFNILIIKLNISVLIDFDRFLSISHLFLSSVFSSHVTYEFMKQAHPWSNRLFQIQIYRSVRANNLAVNESHDHFVGRFYITCSI